jgi:hypothetical protein
VWIDLLASSSSRCNQSQVLLLSHYPFVFKALLSSWLIVVCWEVTVMQENAPIMAGCGAEEALVVQSDDSSSRWRGRNFVGDGGG